ncbi:GGDEF domain-containing protein [Pseudorhodoferax sp. Leaf274]|uniref:GGDEF domain-containing protein n=1 Tax=Pseudorhodoferax sp. Leaf274 TaxID=1736318 RepID=UPI0007034982|nr:GGDEF domain-containing protein [Pseudorhodoferax sp. Leaf274]KQP49124.1 hypothetical protein ASF44_00360 [Pseudorhodoferax sp. Leaf274]
MVKLNPNKLKVELDDLVRQIGAARALLTRINSEIAVARRAKPTNEREDWVDINERLVVAAMDNQFATDSALQALELLTLSAGLDHLTGLPNRAMMQDRITQAIASAKRQQKSLAVLFLDVNHFKEINDSMGHAAGDEVLKKLSRRLVKAVRDVDTVSRHGGDEFLILLPEVNCSEDAATVAGKVARAIGASMTISRQKLRVMVSVGFCLYPADGLDANALIRCADAAMYRAKQRPRQGEGTRPN